MEKEKYDFWRAKLREQLSETAKLFFISFSATVVFLLANYKEDLYCFLLDSRFTCGIWLLIFSAIFYSLFTISRLIDYWRTQDLYKMGKTEQEVNLATKFNGRCTWFFVGAEVITFTAGFFLIVFYLFSAK